MWTFRRYDVASPSPSAVIDRDTPFLFLFLWKQVCAEALVVQDNSNRIANTDPETIRKQIQQH